MSGVQKSEAAKHHTYACTHAHTNTITYTYIKELVR